MKRTVLLILATIVTLVVSTAEGKSTMEKLINKEWHEFDFKTMKAKETYYEKYTGTQRLIVSADEEGNTKMRVQKYYLSKDVQGLGYGRKLYNKAEEFAKKQAYKKLYIETIDTLGEANEIYHHFGFANRDNPLSGSEHNLMNIWLEKDL